MGIANFLRRNASAVLWAILKRADSENSLRALSALSIFLDSLGKRLKRVPEDNGNNSPRM
jgi:hypothetical protein